jgi:hypothetical protein
MRPSRVFRLLVRIFISLLTLTVTVVSILGGLSAVMILSNQDNFGIDTDRAEFNIDVNNSTLEIENVNFTLPFNITNAGYFDLENLQLGIELGLNYSHIVNATVNETRVVKILERTQNFGDIPKGLTGNFTFFGDNSSFFHSNFPDPITEIDWYRGPPALEFYANFTISLDYSIGMHSISITVINIFVSDFTP